MPVAERDEEGLEVQLLDGVAVTLGVLLRLPVADKLGVGVPLDVPLPLTVSDCDGDPLCDGVDDPLGEPLSVLDCEPL